MLLIVLVLGNLLRIWEYPPKKKKGDEYEEKGIKRQRHAAEKDELITQTPSSRYLLYHPNDSHFANNCFVFQEVEELEHKRQKLIDEQVQLKQLKQQLEYLLESHANSDECRRITSSPPDVKPFDHMYYDKALERVKTESIDNTPYDHNVFLLPSPKKVGFRYVFRVFNRK